MKTEFINLYSTYLQCDVTPPFYAKENSKPFLRHISSITDDEAEDIGYDNATSFLQDREDFKDNIGIMSAKEFKYLIEKGFDLFNLIESGQAIDKTTLK